MSSENCHLNGIRSMRESDPEESPKTKKLRRKSCECYANLFDGRSVPSSLAFPAYPANFTIPKLQGKGKSDMGNVEVAGSLLSGPSKVDPVKFQPGSERSMAEGNYPRALSNGDSHSAQMKNSQDGNDLRPSHAFHRDSSTELSWSTSDSLPITDDSGQETPLKVETVKFQPGSKAGGNHSRALSNGYSHSARMENSQDGNDQMSLSQPNDAFHRDSPAELSWSISDPLPITEDSGQESNPGSSDSPSGSDNGGWKDNGLENDDSGYDLHQDGRLERSQTLVGTSALGTDPSHDDYESEDDQDILIIGLSEEEKLEIINGFPPTRPGW